MNEMDEKMKKERGQRLVVLRKAMKLTQAEVASTAGIALSNYNRLENGKRANFRDSIFAKIAEALNTTPEYLMFGDKSEHNGDFSSREVKKDANSRNMGLSSLQTNLIKSLLAINDFAALRKIEESIAEQKENVLLKEQYLSLKEQYSALKEQIAISAISQGKNDDREGSVESTSFPSATTEVEEEPQRTDFPVPVAPLETKEIKTKVKASAPADGKRRGRPRGSGKKKDEGTALAMPESLVQNEVAGQTAEGRDS